ncbi:AI-2E family transporter [Corynebacterium incognita]|uniref:AI-2E family transporter n=1 Tax=Corynebacterium incognita TaxID=2754725 RepID=UPI001FEC9E4F|nr:AI-2E family transporter [Corynebacterium incognita]
MSTDNKAEANETDATPDLTPTETQPVDKSAVWARDGKSVAAWSLRFILTVLGLALAGKLLSYVWDGVLPVILAILVTTVLWPVNKWLFQHGFPRALAALTTLLGFFAIFGGVIVAMAPVVSKQVPVLVNQTEEGLQKLLDYLQGPPLNLQLSQMEAYTEDITKVLKEQSSNIASGVWTGVSAFGSVVVAVVIMFIVTFFLLKDGDSFLPWMRRYTGTKIGSHLTEVSSRIWNTLSGFIQAQATVSLVDAILIGGGLMILKVPLALVLAVITFFGGFIPIIGAFIAGALAVIIALVSNGLTNALLVLGLVILVQQLEGNVLQPMLQSKAMGLHAAVVLLSVTVGSAMAGILGAFLAVPVAATVAVIIRYHAETVALRAGEITADEMELESLEKDEIRTALSR